MRRVERRREEAMGDEEHRAGESRNEQMKRGERRWYDGREEERV